ncbi:MAG TPA: response regulator [Rhodanobacteraceae bacterium]|nr:response regulator [Rhodanobacteraceae bacterium]
MSETSLTRHITSDTPRVMIVDGSRVVRRLIEQLLQRDLPGVTVLSCGSGEEARQALSDGVVDFVSTALRLPDMDGLELARHVRENAPQAYIPIVVVSGDVQERLQSRTLGDDVTDYFDKSLGFEALSDFIRGYVQPEPVTDGSVLYVEDSRVVALATTRMMKKHGLEVLHVVSVEDALALLETAKAQGRIGADVVLTDVNLKGELTGGDLLDAVRKFFLYGKGALPVLVMTGDDNPANQAKLLRDGANDLVQKPIEERLLITKLMFQMRVSRHVRAQAADNG